MCSLGCDWCSIVSAVVFVILYIGVSTLSVRLPSSSVFVVLCICVYYVYVYLHLVMPSCLSLPLIISG